MRTICFIFFTIFLFGLRIYKSAAELDYDEGIINTKVVDYEDSEDAEQEKPMRKDRMKIIRNFVGTNLFGESGCHKKCFSSEDVALLSARRDFESLIPKDFPDCLLDDDLARLLMEYFYGAYQVIEKMSGGYSKVVAEKVFYDTMGGYLNYYMIPISRYSFYGGNVKLRTVATIIELYNQCKYVLNTNGNGWRPSKTDSTDLNVQIEPLKIIILNEEEDISCIKLDLIDEHGGEDEDMIVSLPRLDPEERGVLGNIWLPFKRKRTFNLQSDVSAFILLRYFELTTKCYSFQGISQDTFNKQFKQWILENLEIHLGDGVLYPGLGGVLRIVETLRRIKKGSALVLKREKTKSYKDLVDKTNKLNMSPQDWADEMFGPLKSYAPADNLEQLPDQRSVERRMKYIIIAVAAVICCLILILILIAYLWYKCRSKTKPDNGSPPPVERPKKRWFRKEQEDEKPLIKEKKSFLIKRNSSQPAKPLTATKKSSAGSTMDPTKSDSQETSKCFGLCTKNSNPAIIETTSMDSDTGREKKRKQRTQASLQDKSLFPTPSKSAPAIPKNIKTEIVNEKKRFSISKKHNQKEKIKPDETTSKRVGILRKQS